MYVIFEDWKQEFDNECKTVTWLDHESSVEEGTKVTRKLKCIAYMKFRSNILHKKNFSNSWILGANSICISNICNLTSSEWHIYAINLLEKDHALAVSQSSVVNAPIVFST